MDKNNKLAIILSVISFLGVLACVIFLIIKSYEVGVRFDIGATVVSICTGLIGICAAIMFGMQVWTQIEFKEVRDKINDIDAIRTDLTTQQKKLNNSNIFLSDVIFNAALSNDDLAGKLLMLIMSVRMCCRVQYDSVENHSNVLYARLELLKTVVEKCSSIKGEGFGIDKLTEIEIPKDLPRYYEIMNLYSEVAIMLKGKLEKGNV